MIHESHEIYALALAVLNGEADAHKILADMLEEMGDRGRAQWARRRGASLKKRFDLALGVTPARQTVILACDFAERAGRGDRSIWSNHEEPAWAVHHVRLWLQGDGSLDEMTAACRILARSDEMSWLDLCRQTLADAANCIRQSNDSATKRHLLTQAQHHSRKVASHARNFAADPSYRHGASRQSIDHPLLGADELQWQVSRLRKTLEKRLGG